MIVDSGTMTRTLLLSAFGLFLAIFVALNQKNSEIQIEKIITTYNRRIVLAGDLQKDVVRLSRAQRNYLLFGDPVYIERVLSVNEEIGRKIRALDAVSSAEGRSILSRLLEDRKEYMELISEVKVNAYLRSKGRYGSILREKLGPGVERMHGLLEEIIRKNRQSMKQTGREAIDQLVWARNMTLALSAVMIIFAVSGLVIFLRTKRSLRGLSYGIHSLQSGRFETIPIHPEGRDEFSSLSRAFNSGITRVGRYVEDLRHLAVRDGLTGLYNHRYLQERLEEEVKRSRRSGIPFSVIMADLDHFKKVNDVHGHRAGDEVLMDVSRRFQSALRQSDWVARYGGEEFILFLFETSGDAALDVAEKIRMGVERRPVTVKSVDRVLRVTVSCGIASFPEDGTTKGELIHNADLALYQAKQKGRNQVIRYRNAFARESKGVER